MKLNSQQINEFLWSCAGVDKEVLRLYPSEYAKYAGNGGTILFTALMAMISGGYAMYFVFSNFFIAFLFAIMWALLIFNLDRFIVNSMYTDGKDVITWRKLKSALPRFIMAIFIGIVISTPLEMKIFNDRIESQLLKDNIERINEAKSKSQDYTEYNLLKTEQNKLISERKQLADELLKAQKDLKEEAEGNALSGIAGHGSIYKDKDLYVQQCKTALTEWENTNNNRLTTIQNRLSVINTNIGSFETKIKYLKEDGFSARYEAFSNLKKQNSSLNIVSLMITLLFILIEITPTFFKLIMIGGPYEEHIQMEKYKLTSYIQKQKNNIDTDLLLNETINKDKLSEELNKIKQKEIIKQNILIKQKQNTQKEIKYIQNKPLTYSIDVSNNNKNNGKIVSHTSIKTNNPIKKQDLQFPKDNKGHIIMNFKTNKTKYIF